jgi:diguanylate cyclase (GGDEF)-like protein
MNSDQLPRSGDEDTLIERAGALLDDPAHADNPLRGALLDLLRLSEAQRDRLKRLVRISDGYYLLEHSSRLTLAQRYDRELRRIEKLARISDRYQNSLRELSEALKDAALHDPLTGLGNRRFLMERLKEETGRAARSGSVYALAILDVDRFKAINDHHGHEAGDQALMLIAEAISQGRREYDVCGRWGGEEFLILLPATTLAAATPVLERVRAEVAAIKLPGGNDQLTLTASLGATEHHPGEAFSDTLNRADAALYEAKAKGRNRVECA